MASPQRCNQTAGPWSSLRPCPCWSVQCLEVREGTEQGSDICDSARSGLNEVPVALLMGERGSTRPEN